MEGVSKSPGIFLLNCRVLDVVNGTCGKPSNVWVHRDRIADVGHHHPLLEHSIDCRGMVLMPGLCDAHVHVTACTANLIGLMSLSESLVTARAVSCCMKSCLEACLRASAARAACASILPCNSPPHLLLGSLLDCERSGSVARASVSPCNAPPSQAKVLVGMLRRGFTTVRDCGGADWGLAQAVEEGSIEGPRLLFTGHALSQTGGHGDMRGK